MRPVVPRKVSAYLEDPRVLLGLYLLAALVVALQKMSLGTFEMGGRIYPPYQNYVAFRNAFFHLLGQRDLYAAFPLEQADLFKYTPTFALAMGPIAALPYTVGAVAWNMVNAAALFAAAWWLPGLDARRKAWVLWFVFLSLVGSMQTAQSNGLMAGLMLGAFTARERGRPGLSALLGVAATFAKPFGLFSLAACLAQPGRRRFIGWAALWTLVLLAAPLVVVPPAHLVFLYRHWAALLLADHAANEGLSVMAGLHAWFGLAVPKTPVVAAGTAILLLPLALRGRMEAIGGRTLLVASVLVYAVIFNHMAESPTYVIAILGVALWYFSRQPTPLDTVLLAATFALSCLAATDLVPRPVRMHVVAPWQLKVLPCLLVWIKLQYELMAGRTSGAPSPAR